MHHVPFIRDKWIQTTNGMALVTDEHLCTLIIRRYETRWVVRFRKRYGKWLHSSHPSFQSALHRGVTLIERHDAHTLARYDVEGMALRYYHKRFV